MSVLSELTDSITFGTCDSNIDLVMPHPDWTNHAEEILQKRVLNIRPHLQKSIQMVTQMLDVNTRCEFASKQPLYTSVESWMCCENLDVLWGQVSYELIAVWLKLFQSRGYESMFQHRYHELQEMHPDGRRQRFIECSKIFLGTELYALQTTNQRKLA